jgi:hypothetical protein
VSPNNSYMLLCLEAVSHFALYHTIILNVYKVFENLQFYEWAYGLNLKIKWNETSLQPGDPKVTKYVRKKSK